MKRWSLIEAQDDYVETINAAFQRWSIGGHMQRIARGARKKFEQRCKRMGFTPSQTAAALVDAKDMAVLERVSLEEVSQ